MRFAPSGTTPIASALSYEKTIAINSNWNLPLPLPLPFLIFMQFFNSLFKFDCDSYPKVI
jgi:hypothetical protein